MWDWQGWAESYCVQPPKEREKKKMEDEAFPSLKFPETVRQDLPSAADVQRTNARWKFQFKIYVSVMSQLYGILSTFTKDLKYFYM